MSKDNKVKIALFLDDNFTKPFKNFQKRIDTFNKPFKQIDQSLTALGKSSGFATLSKSTSGLIDSFGKVKKEAVDLGKTMFGGLAVAAGGIFAVAKSTQAYAGNLVDNVKRIGFNVEAYQELAFAAKKSGIENGQFQASLQKMTQSLGEAKAGQGSLFSFLNKTNPALLKQVMATKNSEESFNLLVGALGSLKDKTKQAAFANIVFGKSGANFVNLANAGADGIAQMRKEARDFGVLTADQVETANSLGDVLNSLELVFTNLKNTLGVAVIPVIKQLGEQFTGFIQANKTQIISTIQNFADKLPAAIEMTFNAFQSLMKIGEVLVSGFQFMEGIFGTTNSVLIVLAGTIGKGLTIALWGAMKATIGWGIALMTTPIGWVIAGVAALVGIIYGIVKAIQFVANNWTEIWGGIRDFTSGIFNWFSDSFGKLAEKFSLLKNILPSSLTKGADFNVNTQSVIRNVDTSKAIAATSASQSFKSQSDIKVTFDNAPKGMKVDSKGSDNIETETRMGLLATSAI